MKGLWAAVVLVACAAAVGCGSSGNKTDGGGGAGGGGGAVTGNCALFTACGGNIAGTWRYVSGCATFSSATCPAETAMTTIASGSATYTFGSGGVFAYTVSGTLDETVNYSLGCLSGFTDAGVPQACADVQNLYRMSIGQDAGSSATQIASATCSAGQNETCSCTLVFSVQSGTTQGTYTVSGSQVTITDPNADGGAGTPTDFCVSGNTLTLRLRTDSASNLVMTLMR
jgi:hypothetical protein